MEKMISLLYRSIKNSLEYLEIMDVKAEDTVNLVNWPTISNEYSFDSKNRNPNVPKTPSILITKVKYIIATLN
jgi:hypothetical protein